MARIPSEECRLLSSACMRRNFYRM
ncbi:hypothetical protein RSAG8_09217, partial [Rhizoctonia solani AG-8 WAC10335]